MIAFAAAAALLAVAAFAWLVVHPRRWRRLRASAEELPPVPLPLPPGPRPWPLLGNLLALDARAPHVTLTRLAERYGPVFGMQLGRVYAVVVSDAELIREALRSERLVGRAPLYVTHGIMGGYGLICSEGSLWRDQRRLSISWLKTLGMVKFGSARQRLLQTIRPSIDETIAHLHATTGHPLDPLPHLLHSMGNIMNALVFGRRYAADDPVWLYLQHLQEEGVRHIGVSGAVNFLPWLRWMPGQRKVLDFLMSGKRRTHEIYDRIIAEVAAGMQQRSAADPLENIIELFLRERQQRAEAGDADRLALCSDEQLRHLLADLFGAGVDTTLTTLRWFLLYVARDPKVQQRIRDELSAQLQPGAEPTDEDRDRLPYLRAAIAEAQRIRSVVPLGIPHGVTEDMELRGFRLPAGAMLIPLQWAVHMDAGQWPDPERFRPERFLDGTGEFRAPAAWIPFQSGKRMCPGDELARMMLFAYAGRIVSAFRLRCEGEGGMEGECGITLTPPRSLRIVFEAVEGAE